MEIRKQEEGENRKGGKKGEKIGVRLQTPCLPKYTQEQNGNRYKSQEV